MSPPFIGTHFVAFDSTMAGLWIAETDENDRRIRRSLCQNQLRDLIHNKRYVTVRVPYNRGLFENQLETVLDSLITHGFAIQQVISHPAGPNVTEYIMRRER